MVKNYMFVISTNEFCKHPSKKKKENEHAIY